LDHLRTRNPLLVLDNCEHLIEACSTLVEALRSCPELASWRPAGRLAFVLIAAGLVAFWCDPIPTSRLVARPVYGVFMSWKVDSPPQDRREARQRYKAGVKSPRPKCSTLL
jgi:hypothetical protein